MSEPCFLCPHKCGVDRSAARGRCRCGDEMKICRIAPHYYEEPEISGDNGSGTVFFSGCSLDCEFCQNYRISKNYVGKRYSPAELAEEIKKLEQAGVHNINFVTPTHFSDKIRQTLDIYRPRIPIVYNTSGYELPEVIEKMNDYVDIYLTDFKYSDNETAFRFSKIKNYFDYCMESTELMIKSKPAVYENGLMKQGVIIRHLVLPGQLDNTFAFIDLYKKNFFGRAKLSVMSQFVPFYRSTIKRSLKPLENKLVENYLLKNGIDDCYVQELSSASDTFVPDFITD